MLVAICDDYYSGLQHGLLSGNTRLKNTGSSLGRGLRTGSLLGGESTPPKGTAEWPILQLPSIVLSKYLSSEASGPRALGPSFNSGQVLLALKMLSDSDSYPKHSC